MQGEGKKIQKRTDEGYRILDYAKGMGACEVTETVSDLTAVVNEGVKAIRKCRARGGWTHAFPPTKEGLEEFLTMAEDYFLTINAINENPDMEKMVFPDVEGFCCHMGITRMTLSKYYRTRSDNWRQAIDQIKEVILAAKKQLAATYRVPTTFSIFDLVNNHQYHNVSEFHLTANDGVSGTEIEQERLEAQLDEKGLVWSETRQEFIPVNEVEQDG